MSIYEREMKNEDLKEIQKEELKILQKIKQICEKYNITYFLYGGTLLGAVRHGAHIPWDDDLDIIMFREDYEKFITIAQEELSYPYSIASLLDSKYRKLNYLKIYKEDTKFYEKTEPPEEIYNRGIWVDIFPIDYVNAKSLKSAHKKARHRLYINGVLITFMYKRNMNKKGFKYKLLSGILKKVSDTTIKKWCSDVLSIDKKGNFCTVYSGAYGINKETYMSELFLPARIMNFDGIEVSVPSKAEKILKDLYNDYMKFPPENERTTTHNIFVRNEIIKSK